MILVAGGTGFVGGGIVRELARRGKQFAVLTRDAARSAERFPGLAVEYREGDVRDPSSLEAAIAGVSTPSRRSTPAAPRTSSSPRRPPARSSTST